METSKASFNYPGLPKLNIRIMLEINNDYFQKTYMYNIIFFNHERIDIEFFPTINEFEKSIYRYTN